MDRFEKKCLMKCWENFEKAAHAEKSWMHERLTWLLVPQGVLFAAIGVIIKLKTGTIVPTGVEELLLIIPFMGLLISFSGFLGVVAAGRMHYLWTTRLNLLAERLNKDS